MREYIGTAPTGLLRVVFSTFATPILLFAKFLTSESMFTHLELKPPLITPRKKLHLSPLSVEMRPIVLIRRFGWRIPFRRPMCVWVGRFSSCGGLGIVRVYVFPSVRAFEVLLTVGDITPGATFFDSAEFSFGRM